MINTDLVGQLELCLEKFCYPLYKKLLPPLENAQIESFFKRLHIKDKNIWQLYEWKNGIINDGKLPTHSYNYTNFGVIPNLEYINHIRNLDIYNELWSDTFVPIVVSYSGNFLLYESDKRSQSYGMLFLYSPTLGYVYDLVTYHDSIDQLILTIIESFKSGVFVYDSKNMILEVNHNKYFEIAKSLNPRSDFWL